jgi:hypothetical protein
MLKRIMIAGAGLAALQATPSAAQVVGKWQYELFPGEPTSFRISRDPAHPELMYATGYLHGSLIAFVGEFRNLKWYGTWYWYGPGSVRLPGLRTCAAAVTPRPGTPGYGQRTTHTGGFEFTFNAAENQIRGSWKSACSGPDGRAESGQPIDFSAMRMNTYTATAPTARLGNTSISTTPAPSTGGDEPRLLGEVPPDDRPCAQIARFKISTSGSGSAPDTLFSARYQLRPCLTSAAKKVQVDLLNPEGKRPIRLVLQGLRVSQQVTGPRPVIVASPTGVTYQQGLPFIGEPRAGQAIMNIPMAGRICAAPMWQVWLDFSDGTRSREPIGALLSVCGMQAHPELMPARSGGDGPRPVGELRPAGS